MKKVFILIMALIMVLGMVGCSTAPAEEAKDEIKPVEEVQAPVEPTEPAPEEATEPAPEPTEEPEIVATNTVIDYIENNGVFVAELQATGLNYNDGSVNAVLSAKDGKLVFSMTAGERVVDWYDMSLEEFADYSWHHLPEKINVFDVNGSMFNYFDIEITMDHKLKKADGKLDYIIYDGGLKTYKAPFSFNYGVVLSNGNFSGIIGSSGDGFNTDASMANEELQKIALKSLECISKILNENQIGVTLNDLGWDL